MKPYLSIILILSFVRNTGQSSKDTEIWSPIPKKVNSISDSSPPDDAIILFDGTDLSSWQARWGEKDSEWQINEDGSMTVVFDGTGGIQTKENFGSVQLHIEWKTSEDYLTKIRTALTVEFFYRADMKFKF